MVEFLHDEIVGVPLDSMMRLVKDEERDLAHLQPCDAVQSQFHDCLPGDFRGCPVLLAIAALAITTILQLATNLLVLQPDHDQARHNKRCVTNRS